MRIITLDKRFVYIGTILLCAIILTVPALINNFPFLYADTGTYIYVGFTNEISEIRPILYGIFLRHMSLRDSLWLVIMVQAVIVSWVICRFFRTFFTQAPAYLCVIVIALLTLCTGLGVTTGMLMPDFLTPVLVLALSMLLFSGDTSLRSQVLLAVVLWFAISCHHSHPYILFGVLIGIGIWMAFSYRLNEVKFPIRRFLAVCFIGLIGYFTIPYLNYMRNGRFVRSYSTNVFLMGRLNQTGLLKPFLDEACGSVDYRICQYKDSIPDDFLWSPDSPVLKGGGWFVNNNEYREVLKDFFSRFYYLKKFAIKSFETAAQQFFSFDVVIIVPETASGYPYNVIKDHLPEFIPAIKRSLQYQNLWSNKVIDLAQRILVFASMLFLVYFFFYQNQVVPDTRYRDIAALIFIALLANAIVCAGVSMVDPRFQSRLIWIVPMYALALGQKYGYIRMPLKKLHDKDRHPD